MAQFLNFGNGHDGDASISGDPNTRTGCSGSASSTSLTVDSESGFAVGDMVLIHKSRGETTTTCGTWEVNIVTNVAAGTLTLSLPLVNAYQNSGADQSQCVLIPQYKSLTITGGGPATWDGSTGGIYAVCVSGKCTISGTLNADSKGFDVPARGQGEGTAGAGGGQGDANGNGGGGNYGDWHIGGGGGHAAVGDTGVHPTYPANTLAGGTTSGAADLATMTFGGAGGCCTSDGGYGNGGGIILIFAREIEVTGAITCDGSNNDTSVAQHGGGGGSAGGSILIKAVNAVLGSTLVGATGGTGANSTDGSVGRIRVEACSITGTTSPAASEEEGGQNWCGSVAAIIGG